MAQETSKESLYRKLNEVKTNHDKALNVYGTQTMNEVLEIVDSYFENLPVTTDKLLLEKLQEQLNTAKKALTEIDCSRYGMQFRRDRNPNIARQALAAIGGDDEC